MENAICILDDNDDVKVIDLSGIDSDQIFDEFLLVECVAAICSL